MANIKYQKGAVTVTIGQTATVELPPRVMRVRLTGMLFETDKTFLLPSAMKGIRGLVDYYQEHPNLSLVVTGHTDRVGAADYNLALSDERAQRISEYLRDLVDPWLGCYQGSPHSQPWGTREDQYMLSAITDDSTGDHFYTGPVTGELDGPTVDAVKRFQRSRGLADDGQPGPDTRRALITAYMQLEGTTLPASAQLAQLGCGENHNEVPTADQVDEPKNRRVEIFLFDPGPPDPPVPARCPGPGCPYETWKARSAETIDVDHDLCQLLVEVDSGGDDPQAVPDAGVTLTGPLTRQQPSDKDGRAWFKDLVAGHYSLEVEKGGFAPASREVDVAQGGVVAPTARSSLRDAGDGAGDADTGSGGNQVVHVTLSPDDFAVRLADPWWMPVAGSEAEYRWDSDACVIHLNESNEDVTVSADKDGVCRTPRKNNQHAVINKALRTAPHRAPISWRLLDFGEAATATDLTLAPGNQRVFDISSRLRISAWAFVSPFATDQSGGVNSERIKLFKKARVDDLSLVWTLTWDPRTGKTNEERRAKPANPPVWHPKFRIAGVGFGSGATPTALVTYLKNLASALHPEVLLQAGFEIVAADAALEKDFVEWLSSASPKAINDYAAMLRKFFDDLQIEVDGIGFDFEIATLKPEDAGNMGLLYTATSDAFADKNGFISYATAPYVANVHYAGTNNAWVESLIYNLATRGANIVARPMLFSTLGVEGRDKIQQTIDFALSDDATAKLHPSQLQMGIDPTRFLQTTEVCQNLLRPHRVGLVVAAIGQGDFSDAFITQLTTFEAALNPGESAPHTTGQPLQVPGR